MTRTRTFKASWESYERDVLPKDAPPIQRRECKQAFYGGAHAILCLMLGQSATLSDDEGIVMIERLQQELQQFVVQRRAN